MNKKILALSVAAAIGGISTSASAALTFNADGVGHILIQPYFTAQEGNSTLINLVNTDTVKGKAVKVRFRSAGNSDDVLDFQVFLSPGDVWTASVSEGADGRAMLTTADKTCTVPAIPAGGVSFITNNLPPSATDAEKASWTREGYVEFLNMGDIVKNADTTTDAYKLYVTTKHVNGVAPCDTAILNDPTKVEPGLSAPTSGLMGNWTIINVPSAASWAGESAALVSGGTTNVVYSAQNGDDSGIAAADINKNTADPLLIQNGKVANFDLPDLSTPYDNSYTDDATAQAKALTAALAVTSVTNEFLTNAAIAAETDWVFSMPTRRYHIAYDYTQTSSTTKRVFNVDGVATNVIASAEKADYAVANEAYFNSGNTEVSGNLICVKLGGVANFDQEEGTATTGVVFSPGTIETVKFCGEGTVVKFNGSNVLGASVATGSLTSGYSAGWTTITTTTAAGSAWGLPVLGQSFVQATNSAVAAGVSGNFGAGWAHRVTRAIP